MDKIQKSYESVLRYLIEKPEPPDGLIRLGMNSYHDVASITPDDFALYLRKLAELHLIDVKFDNDRNPTSGCRIRLFESGRRYFEFKRKERHRRICKGIREWLTPIIAVLAFGLSVFNLIWQIRTYNSEKSQSNAPVTQSEITDSTIDGIDSASDISSGTENP